MDGGVVAQASFAHALAFYGTLCAAAVGELLRPLRPASQSRPSRWTTNFGLFAISVVLVRLLVPVTSLAAAVAAVLAQIPKIQEVLIHWTNVEHNVFLRRLVAGLSFTRAGTMASE